MRACLFLAVVTACASAGVERGIDGGDSSRDAAPSVDSALQFDAAVNQCATTETCPTAATLGSVSGDTANQKLTAVGDRAAWFRVHVTEDDSELSGLKLRVAAKLTSPAAANFDIVAYVNAASPAVECSTTVGTTTMTGAADEVRVEWGEGSIANGADDGRDVSIEIRPPTAGCTPGQTWMLEIEGNWN